MGKQIFLFLISFNLVMTNLSLLSIGKELQKIADKK
jgi:hypothetical protein